MIWYLIGAVILLIIIGGTVKITDVNKIYKDNLFLIEYFKKYTEYLNEFISRDFSVFLKNDAEKNLDMEGELFAFLMGKAGKAQNTLGSNGYLSNYQHGNMILSRYQLLINTIPNLRFPDMYGRDFEMLRNMIHMTITENEGRLEKYRTEIKNPFSLLREGINFLVTSPIRILYWSGVMEYGTFNKLTNNWLLSFINGFIILVGFFGSIITILLGWDDTISLVTKYIW